MTDPYKVLGIGPNATDEQVRTAYRELAKKYHPDNYVNNPLSDLAQEKMAEINEAYDQIMNMRRGNASSNSNSRTTGGYGATGPFADIRRLISQNRIVEAEELLDGIPVASRNAEWYFLKGSVFYARGWLNEAEKFFRQAASMEPGNSEYASAVNQIAYQRSTGYAQSGYGQANGGSCSACDMCSSLICADCCCECMGGDLIRCC